jgi:hypothetical protein
LSCWRKMSLLIYLLTPIGLSPGGNTHLHTNNTQNNTNNNRTTQITTHVEECGPCPIFASFTLAFALQPRKKHEKTSVTVRKTSVRVQYTYVACPENFRMYRMKIFQSYLEAIQPCRLQSTLLYSVCTAASVSSMF